MTEAGKPRVSRAGQQAGGPGAASTGSASSCACNLEQRLFVGSPAFLPSLGHCLCVHRRNTDVVQEGAWLPSRRWSSSTWSLASFCGFLFQVDILKGIRIRHTS